MDGADDDIIVEFGKNLLGEGWIVSGLPELDSSGDDEPPAENRARFDDFEIGLKRRAVIMVLIISVHLAVVREGDCTQACAFCTFA